MQNIFTNIKCSEIILYNANENWYIILYDLFSRLCYIATCGPFCKDATHLRKQIREAKRKYYDHIFSLYKNDIKNTWKILNETLNRNGRKHQSQDFFYQ